MENLQLSLLSEIEIIFNLFQYFWQRAVLQVSYFNPFRPLIVVYPQADNRNVLFII